jgi:hypothetical protein
MTTCTSKGAATSRLLLLTLLFCLFGVRWLAAAFTVSPSSASPSLSRLPSHKSRVSSTLDLTVHEWGTFTSISDPDGHSMDWLPLTNSTDLPSFVEHFRDAQFKGGLRGTIRMETPVLYFYSPDETTVSVNVSFAKGLITEWYPHANSANPALTNQDFSLDTMKSPGSISWNSVHVDPHAATDFPCDNSENHYYAARQTSSSPIDISTSSGMQREKFLFYRGVSAFLPPLNAIVSSDNTVVIRQGTASDAPKAISESRALAPEATFTGTQDHPEPIPNVILFERRGAQLGYRILGPLRDQAALTLPTLDGSLDSLSSDLEGILISQGLFPDEAHAMLETWKSSWFEEGSRLIYIVPRSFVDSVLPLHINPVPASTVRVFVGRLELITPATQQAVESAFATNDTATLAKYKRFLDPILWFMLQSSANDAERSKRLLKDLETASQLY